MPDKSKYAREIDKFSFAQFAVRILPKTLQLVVSTVFFFLLLPVYWIGCLIWHRPPNVPYLSNILRYLKLAWSVSPQNPSIPLYGRLWLFLNILQSSLNAPFLGILWFIDELLYGRALDELSVEEPFFVISGGRSGSTQISRYIEEDPNLVAPNILQLMFPYLWLWRLAPKTIGRMVTPDKVRQMIQATMPAEMWERHEADPFKTDTFDGSFYGFHLRRFSVPLGPEVAINDFNMAAIAPYDKTIKEIEFVKLVDRLARKSLLFDGEKKDGVTRRFFLKGHFLYAAQVLSEKYPHARFLAVGRDPLSRIRSGINYLRVNPADPVMGPTPWNWLVETILATESQYCDVEREWFSRQDETRKCFVKFTDFVDDLQATMKYIYGECFDTQELPPHIPEDHPPRDRKNYSVNRTLADLGVDTQALADRNSGYINWLESL